MNKLNPSIKHHLLVGALIGIWIFLFVFFVKPFEHGQMDLDIWISVSIGFGIIAFICYGILSLTQKWVYQKLQHWTILSEIIVLVLFQILLSIGSYLFYKESLVNGPYNFIEFFTKITLNTALILTPILIIARRYLIKLIPVKEPVLTIKGDNKLDILKIKKSELLCISNAQNYVEIFYVQNDELKSKLIRSSLKKMQEDLGFLIQVHRSHLINASHFRSWKNNNTILLTQLELPVSKNYKENLMSL